MHVHYFQPEAGDPLHQPEESSLIGHFGPEGGGARAYGDLAIVEFGEQCRSGLPGERDLVRLRLHQNEFPEAVWLRQGIRLVDPCCQRA